MFRRHLLVAIAAGLAMTACGNATTPFVTPTPELSTCTSPAPATLAALPPGQAVIPAAAALLHLTIVAEPAVDGPRQCVTLSGGIPSMVHLKIGDSVQFEANSSPDIKPQDTNVITIATRPVPQTSGRWPSSHVTVTVTAIFPGSVTLEYINCSGTAC